MHALTTTSSVTPVSGSRSGQRSDPHQVTFGSAPSGNKRSNNTAETLGLTTYVKTGRDEEALEMDDKALELEMAREEEEATLRGGNGSYGSSPGPRLSVVSHSGRHAQDVAFANMNVQPSANNPVGQISVRVEHFQG